MRKKMISGCMVWMSIAMVSMVVMPAWAADDPTIPRQDKRKIQAAMKQYIKTMSQDKKLLMLNPKVRVLLHLRAKKLHSGVFRKGPYFASCADFVDQTGNLYDLDFLVRKNKGGGFQVVQALIHKKNGKKWSYRVQK